MAAGAAEARPLVDYAEEEDYEESDSGDEYIVPRKRARMHGGGAGGPSFQLECTISSISWFKLVSN